MQKRNRQIQYIGEAAKRQNAKTKRTKHIIKKMRELSILCNLNLNLAVYDVKLSKVTEYATDAEITIKDLTRKLFNNGGHSPSDN